MDNLIDSDLAKLYDEVSLRRGSKGRTIPNTLDEQLAMKEVLSDPLSNAIDLSEKGIKLGDTRWKPAEG